MKNATMKVNLELADADVRKMLLGPGDVVVISVSVPITPERASELLEVIADVWPDNKGIVLTEGVELAVVTPSDDDGSELIETARG